MLLNRYFVFSFEPACGAHVDLWLLYFFLCTVLVFSIEDTKTETRDVDSNILVTILDVPLETHPTLVAEVTLATLVVSRVERLMQLETSLSVKSPVTLLTLMGSGVNHPMLRQVILPSCLVVTMSTGMQLRGLLRTFWFVVIERVPEDES